MLGTATCSVSTAGTSYCVLSMVTCSVGMLLLYFAFSCVIFIRCLCYQYCSAFMQKMLIELAELEGKFGTAKTACKSSSLHKFKFAITVSAKVQGIAAHKKHQSTVHLCNPE